MKTRFAHVAVIMTGMLVLSLLVASTAGANGTLVQLDAVNIGDTTSEATHNLLGWSNIWSECDWCGPDGDMRLIWGSGEEGGCAPENNWASVTLDAGTGLAKELIIEHLDGAANDGFNVYVNGTLVGTFLDIYNANTWVTYQVDISSWDFSGLLTVEFEATGTAWSLCSTYGQVAINMIELHGVPVLATIDIDPNTLNLKSEGGIITAFIELPDGFDVGEIDPSSILLNGSVPAIEPATIGYYDLDGVPDLMVKFDRDAVQATLVTGDSVEITITGQVAGIDFVGADTIRVINVGVRHRGEDASSVVY